MTICTFKARTAASEASIEDLMVQARKTRYDVLGLTVTRRNQPLNATIDTGKELFLGICHSRGFGGDGVLVNKDLSLNIDSLEQLTILIGRLRLRRCGSTPALTVFVAYAPTSSYDEDEIEAFYMDLEKFYREDHTFYKIIVGDFNAKIGELHIGTAGLQWNEQGERLSEFIMTTKTIHGTSQFKKSTSLRWTWESPGGKYHKEIDHIIVNRREAGYAIPSVFFSEVRHVIKSVNNRTALGPDRIRPEHLKNLPTALVDTLARLFTRYLSEWSNFTTRISPFYDDITIDVRRGVRQSDIVSPKLFTATLEDVTRRLEWDNMGVRVDGRLLHHLRFTDDIVLITPNISQAERMLADFDDACRKIGLQLNLTKTMFMSNGWATDAPFSLNGTTISECSSYVYLGRKVEMNDHAPELGRRKRTAWGAYKSIEDAVKKTKNIRLRAHLFNTTVLLALTYASETWALPKQDEKAVGVIEHFFKRVMLGVTRLTQVKAGIRSSTLCQQSKMRNAAVYAKLSKSRRAGHVMRLNDHRGTRAVSEWTPRNIKRTTGRPPTELSDFITKSLEERYDALRLSRTYRTHWTTLTHERDKWKDCWRPLGIPDDQ
ncbi:hypothetical protein Y032_0017g3304 [Ancylostoma ceylanicum]|uniref:Reverse transcriptase domain-containing protein n=1 Tax=Ancylostoma ceylanicum TaxID=53326 RepID=A0A016V5R2_9BILA|nr:hypothetical protein Y032_0017g3304 [Ancylostoma ceylanicum]